MKQILMCGTILLLVPFGPIRQAIGDNQAPIRDQPEFITVFQPDLDGFRSIRIPSIVVTRKGAVLALAEGRAANKDQADNKIILKRSTDGGSSWSSIKVLADGGRRSLNNPCAVVDEQTCHIFLMYQQYPEGIAERSKQLTAGLTGEFIVRNMLIVSQDEGLTWCSPKDVTSQTKHPEHATTLASGPGIGIQLHRGMHKGRILIPFNEGPYGLWNIFAVYSDDHGKSWHIGGIAPAEQDADAKGSFTSTVNEAQFVEGLDGSIRFNVRRWAGKPLRKTSVSGDGGETWSQVEDVPEQMDPSCMASIFRYSGFGRGEKNIVIYSGPQSTRRENGTVFLSADDGKTWSVKRVLEPGNFAYSVLTRLPDGRIGCLFEADNTSRIVLSRFSLNWLTKPKYQ